MLQYKSVFERSRQGIPRIELIMATRPRKGKETRPVVPSPLTRSPSVGRLAFRHRAQSIIGSKALDELELEVSEGLLCEPSEVESGSKYSLIVAEVFYCKLIES